MSVLSLLAIALAAAAPAETPRAFVARVYAQYRRPQFSPLDRPEGWFAPALAAAFREDSRLAKGEIGYLNGDPLCDCQDYRRIQARITGYDTLSPRTVRVRVHVDLGVRRFGARDLRLKLQRTAAGWRIADIASAHEPSLLRAIEASNRKIRSWH